MSRNKCIETVSLERNGMTSPSKITDYFPPSPKAEKGKEVESLLKKSAAPDTVINVLTPDSSPSKESVKEEDAEELSKPNVDKDKDDHICRKQESDQTKSPSPNGNPPSTKKKRKSKKKTVKKKPEEVDFMNNSLVTDYFPIRRSTRRCKSDLEKQKKEDLESKILNKCEDGLKVVEFPHKGRGVVAAKKFIRGDFVVEYAGDLIDIASAKEKEQIYSKNPETGCYMYYFCFKNKSYCIDATAESGRLGRLINHSRTSGNCHTKLIEVCGNPVLILQASRDIKEGEELLYDYGDRNKESLASHPWLSL